MAMDIPMLSLLTTTNHHRWWLSSVLLTTSNIVNPNITTLSGPNNYSGNFRVTHNDMISTIITNQDCPAWLLGDMISTPSKWVRLLPILRLELPYCSPATVAPQGPAIAALLVSESLKQCTNQLSNGLVLITKHVWIIMGRIITWWIHVDTNNLVAWSLITNPDESGTSSEKNKTPQKVDPCLITNTVV